VDALLRRKFNRSVPKFIPSTLSEAIIDSTGFPNHLY
jgi:hypothetical protein